MNSEVNFESKKFLSIKEASSLTSYSKDYIGQLSRQGKIISKRVGRKWFVDEASLLQYKNTPTSFDFTKNFQGKTKLLETSTRFVPISEASFLTGYSKDYVGQLARFGKIESKRDGKKWLVGEASLIKYQNTPTSFDFSKNFQGREKKQEIRVQSKEKIDKVNQVIAKVEEAPSFLKTLHHTIFLKDSNFAKKLAPIALAFLLMIGSFSAKDIAVEKIQNTASARSAIANPFEVGGKIVFVGVNSFLDKNLFSPIASFFATPEVFVPRYIVQKSEVKNNLAPTGKVQATSNPIRVVERIVEKEAVSDVNKAYVDLSLSQLKNKLTAEFSKLGTGTGGAVTNIYQQVAHSQKIDNLYNTAISNPTITGGSITNTSISATSLSATSASLSSITTPSLTLSGTSANSVLSTDANGLTVATSTPTFNNFNALSSTATSTVGTGGLAVGNNHFVIQQNSGRIGIGTTSPTSQIEILQTANGVPILTAYRNTDLVPTGDFINYKTYGGTTLFRVDNSGNLLAGGIINSGSQTITSVSTPQLRVQYDGSNEATFSTNSVGSTTIAASGANSSLNFATQNNLVNAFNFMNAAGTSILNIDTLNGRVGVGTTSPSSLLSLNGTGSTNGITFDGDSATNLYKASAGIVGTDGNLWAKGGNLYLKNSNGVFSFDNTNLSIMNNAAGVITLSANSGQTVARFIGTTATANYLDFTSNSTGLGPTITSQGETNVPLNISSKGTGDIILNGLTAGNVGIGTTSPWKTFSVVGTVAFPNLETSTDNTTYPGVFKKTDGTIFTETSVTVNPANDTVYLGSDATAVIVGGGTIRSNGSNDIVLTVANFNPNGVRVSGTTGFTGISSTTPWGALSVNSNGLGSAPAFVVGSSTATNFIVNNSGNVGIGTANPTRKLSILGSGGNTGSIAFYNSSNPVPYVGIAYNQTSDSLALMTNVGSSDLNTTPFSISRVTSAVSINQGSNVAGNGLLVNSVGSTRTVNIWADDSNAYIYSNSGDTPLVLNTSGNVGIGTTTPFTKLSVKGSGYFDGNLTTTNLTATGTLSVTGLATITNGFVSQASSTVVGNFTTTGTLTTNTISATSASNLSISSGSGATTLFNNGATWVWAIDSARLYPATDNTLDFGITTNKIRTGYFGTSLVTPAINNGGSDLTINASGGNVGIGTTTPGSKLSISGGASIGANYGTAAPTNGLIVEGNVGIGTTAPANRLNIKAPSSGNSPQLYLQQYNDDRGWKFGAYADGNLHIFSSYTTTDTERITVDYNNGNLGIGTTTPGQKLSVAGDILGNNIIGSYFTATSTTATTTLAGGLAIETSGLVYDYSTNNVGIGTASPSNRLHIVSDSLTKAGLLVTGGQSIGGASYALSGQISLGSNTAVQGNLTMDANIGSVYLDNTYDSTASNIYFRTRTSGTPVNAMAILGSGNVGVGTVSPGAKLDVQGAGGTSYTSADLIVSNSTTATKRLAMWYDNTNNVGRIQAVDMGVAYRPLVLQGEGSSPVIIGASDLNLLGTPMLAVSVSGAATSMQIGDNATGHTLANLYTSADTNGYFGIQSYKAQGSLYGDIILNGASGNVGIGTTSPGVLKGGHDLSGYRVLQLNSPDRAYLQLSGAQSIVQMENTDGTAGMRSFQTYFSADKVVYNFQSEASGAVVSNPLTLQANGNVGIGTNSVTNSGGYSTLGISGSTGGQLEFQTGGVGKQYIFSTATDLNYFNNNGAHKFTVTGGEKMRVDSNGNVGIGTTTPSTLLSISGGGTSNLALNRITTTLANNSTHAGTSIFSSDSNWTNPFATRIDTPDQALTTQDAVNPDFMGYVGSSFSRYGGMTILGVSDGTNGVVGVNITGALGSASPTSAAVEIMGQKLSGSSAVAVGSTEKLLTVSNFSTDVVTVLGSGNFGIGTTTPNNKLSIGGGDETAITITRNTLPTVYLGDSGSRNSGDLLEYNSTGVLTNLISGGGDSYISAGKLGIGTSNIVGSTLSVVANVSIGSTYYATAAPTNGLIVEGNVGFGTSTPQAALSISGASTALALYNTGQNRVVTLDAIANGSQTIGRANFSTAFGSTYAGTTANPAIYMNGDATTGFYTPATNMIGVTISGTERVRIDSSGNVGIGTTTPWAQLSVNPNGITGPAFVIGSSTATNFIVTNGGNVGIGTTTSKAKLTITGSTSASPYTTGTFVINDYSDPEKIISTGIDTSVGAYGYGWIQYGKSGVAAAPLVLNPGGGNVGIGTTNPGLSDGTINKAFTVTGATSNDSYLALQLQSSRTGNSQEFTGIDAWNQTYKVGSIQFLRDTADNSGAINFKTASVGTMTERMRIDSSGNVGIGTTSPYTKLAVSGTGNIVSLVESTGGGSGQLYIRGADTNIILNKSASSQQNYIGFQTAGTSNWIIGTTNGTDGNTTNFKFFDYGSAEIMTLTTGTANVGIGTTSPYAKLSVTNTSANPSFVVEDSASPDTTPFIIDASGNVGIGTTSPDSLLQIGGITNVKIDSNGAYTSTYNGETNPRIQLNRDLFGSGLGGIGFNQTGGSTMATNGVGIGLAASQELGFFTTSGSALTERVRITQAGKMGIGSTTPWAQLSVNPNGITGPSFVIGSSTATNFIVTNGGNVGIGTTTPIYPFHVEADPGSNSYTAYIKATRSTANQNNGLLINAGTSVSDSSLIVRDKTNTTTFLTVLGNGNVGIGNTSSTRLLQVTGSTGYVAEINQTASDSNGLIVNIANTTSVQDILTLQSNSVNKMSVNGAGNITANFPGSSYNYGAVSAFTNGVISYFSSDRRLKHNIQPIEEGLAVVRQLKPSTYNLNADNYATSGFIAQDVLDLVPGAATVTPNDGMLMFNINGIVAFTTRAVQELDSRTAFLSSATTTEQMFIDVDGNVGIGTSTPAYKLHVLGDIAGTSFVNISTRDSKKDIEYITEESKSLILDTIGNIKIAKYHYNEEDPTAPLRLGLIAEEAPSEILSASGKGVDIYKLATYTLAGVQELSTKVVDMETRLSNLESNSNGLVGGINVSLATVTDYLAGVGMTFVNGVTNIASLVTENLKVGSAEKPSGITLYDEVTKDPYCLKMSNGAMVSMAGECSVSTTTPPVDNSNSTSTPATDTSIPTITILGDNPATITMGTAYSDMGATVTDTNADGSINNNLGLHYNVDGTDMVDIQIDTTATSTHTIIYSSIDGAGNTGTATRIVNVVE